METNEILSSALEKLATILAGERIKVEADLAVVERNIEMISRLRSDIQQKLMALETSYAQHARAVTRHDAELARLGKYATRLIDLLNSPVAIPTPAVPSVQTVLDEKDQIVLSLSRGASRIDRMTSVCGIYFLFEDDEIVYIGQSVNVLSRVSTHITDPEKRFNRACYVPIAREELNDIEDAMIAMFKPRHNKRGLIQNTEIYQSA